LIVVTGGAGFIGSNIVRGLNLRGIDDILVVDDLTDGRKFANLVDAEIADYLDKEDFLRALSGIDFVAADINPVSPPHDVGGMTAFLAATVALEILTLFCVSPGIGGGG